MKCMRQHAQPATLVSRLRCYNHPGTSLLLSSIAADGLHAVPGAATQQEHALGGLIDRSGSRGLAEDASSTGSGGAPEEASPAHPHLPHRPQAPNLASSPRSRAGGAWDGGGGGRGRDANGREATADLARRMSEEVSPHSGVRN